MIEYTTEQKRKDALQEYYFIEDLIDRFDQRSLVIKSWSITLCTAVFAAAIINKSPEISIVSAIAGIIFWYLESIWKYFQEALSDRIHELENILETDIISYTHPKIAFSFRQHFSKPLLHQRIPYTLWYVNVMIPHILISTASFIVFIYYRQ